MDRCWPPVGSKKRHVQVERVMSQKGDVMHIISPQIMSIRTCQKTTSRSSRDSLHFELLYPKKMLEMTPISVAIENLRNKDTPNVSDLLSDRLRTGQDR